MSRMTGGLRQDLRAAVRSLAGTPAVPVTAILILSLGIGTNAAMYDMLRSLFLDPPPQVRAPDGIHRVYVREFGLDGAWVRSALEENRLGVLRSGEAWFSAFAGYSGPWPMRDGLGQAADELDVRPESDSNEPSGEGEPANTISPPGDPAKKE